MIGRKDTLCRESAKRILDILYEDKNASLYEIMDRIEKICLTRILAQYDGNRHYAAEFLKVHRPTMLYRLKKFGINVKKGKRGKQK